MSWKDVEFSVDLVTSAYNHLCFLDRVDNFEKILRGEALRHGLRRYEQLWLPLACENRSVSIEAPIDVYWLWYIHMLQPLAYRRDCRKAVKTVLDHNFNDEKKLINNTNRAIEIWYSSYPKEGYNIIRNNEYVKPIRNKGQVNFNKPSKFSVDLISLAEAHMHFCYQVALPHFRDKMYLQSAMNRYKQFLCLKRLEPDEFLTPSVDILLMWYTHMCSPVAYANDMMKICGKVFNNNVKVIPGKINDRFVFARNKTSELWKKISAEELMVPGTKLRSHERRREIMPMTVEDLQSCCVIEYTVTLSHADLPDMHHSKLSHLDLVIYRTYQHDTFMEELITLEGSKAFSFSLNFQFNSAIHKGLKVVLRRSSKIWCMRGQSTIASGHADLKSKLENLGFMEKVVRMNVDMTSDDKTRVTKLKIEGTLKSFIPVVCRLQLGTREEIKPVTESPGAIETSDLSDSFHTSDGVTYVATHSLVQYEHVQCFRCCVKHMPERLHSSVEIYFNQKLVSTSHLIGSSQLPRPSQVAQNDISLAFDPELGERAMLVRNHNGDWGLCIARWTNDGVKDEGGGLDVRFIKLVGTGKVQRFDFVRTDIEFQSFNADVFAGTISINPGNNTVAENLAVFWSMCVLYALCRPIHTEYSLDYHMRATNSSIDVNEDGLQTTTKISDKFCQFLEAAGVTTKTPSNDYMREKFGSLTHDLLIDAPDVIVEEQITNRKLLKHESLVSLDDESQTPVKKLKKKRSSKLKESLATTPEDAQTVDTTTAGEEPTKQTAAPVVKRKRVRKRQSSKLEDMLSMSDDSITKEEVLESKVVKDDKGRRIVIKKISSNISHELTPSEDSLDEAEKELKQFKEGLHVPRGDSDASCSSREGKTRTEDISEKTKPNPNRLGVEDDVEFNREETSLIKDVAEKKRQASARRNRDENDNRKVVFDLGEHDDNKPSDSSYLEGTDSYQDEKLSDTSSIIGEFSTRSDRRKLIAQDRENKFPLSDEDAKETERRNRRRKRKKSKQKIDVPEPVAEQ